MYNFIDEQINQNLKESAKEEHTSNYYDLLRDILEESVKTQMGIIISEMANDEQKSILLSKLNSLYIYESDLAKVVDISITPAVEICETYTTTTNPKIIPIALYEVMCILHDIKNNNIDVLSNINYKDAIDRLSEHTDQEFSKMVISEAAIQLLESSVVENGISEKYYDDIIEEAVNLLSIYEFKDFQPNILEAVDFIVSYNMNAEINNDSTFDSILESVILGNNSKYISENVDTEDGLFSESSIEKINKYISGAYDTIIDSSIVEQLRESAQEMLEFTFNAKFNLPSSKTIKIGAGVAGGLGAVAIGLLAIRAYIRRKDGVCSTMTGRERIKCLINGCDEAIRSINSYKKLCNEQGNPEKCEERMNKLIEKWEKRKEKLLSKL